MTDAAYRDPQEGTFGGATPPPPSQDQGQSSPQPGGDGGPAQQADPTAFSSGNPRPQQDPFAQLQQGAMPPFAQLPQFTPPTAPRSMLPPFDRHHLQQFIPSMGNRPPQAWGKDRQWPMRPRHWEIPGIMRGIGMQIAQYGSAYSAPLGAALGEHTGAWMKGYMQGQEARARLIHEQAIAKADQLHEQLGTELDAYSKIYATYGGDPKNSAALEHALSVQAGIFNDHSMQTALATDHVAGAQRIIQWLDAKHSDLGITNAERRKQADERAAEAPWQANPTDDAGVPMGQQPPPDILQPSPDTPSPLVADPGQKAPDASPGLGIVQDPSQQQTPDQQQQPPTQQDGQQRGPPTAQAGANDGPDAGAPDRPQPYKQTPSRALAQAQQAGKNSQMINQLAQKMASGLLRPQDYKGVPNDVLALANARRLEIESEFSRIQQSDLKGQDALKAVAAVDPEFASALAGYVNGDFPVPSGVRNLPILQRIIGLGQKVDPYFTAASYQQRNAAVKQWTSGVDGRNLVSQLTSLDHINYLKQLAKDIPYIEGGGPAFNRWYQWALQQGPQSEWYEKARKARDAMNLYEAEVHLVAPEIARAQKGAAPTQAEEQAVVAALIGKDPESIAHNIDGAEVLIRHRLAENAQRFRAAMGGHPVEDYEKLFSNFERKGVTFEGEPGPGTGLRSGRSYSEELQHQLQQPMPQGQGAPLGAQPQQQGGGGQSDDDAARAWANAHPNDPRAKKILEGLK